MASAEQDRKKQHRSPAYPSLGIKAALDFAGTIYEHEKRTAAPVSVVAEHCGTDIKSSKGLRLIAAMKQYGLVSEEGNGEDRQVKLSDRALDILLSDDESKKKAAIKAAAYAPPLHRKILDKYPSGLPSDATLKLYLLRELDFNDAYVDRFIKQFRNTLAFTGTASGDIIADKDGKKGAQVRIGSFVQWISDGVEQFATPQEVEGISEDGQWAFIVGENTGVPMAELEVAEQPAIVSKTPNPPPNPHRSVSAPKDTVQVGILPRDVGSKIVELPIALPSLQVAVLKVPYPLSEIDFKTLTNTLSSFEHSLTKRTDEKSE